MKIKKKILLSLIIFAFILGSIFFPYDLFMKYTNGMYVTSDEFKQMLDDNFVLSANISNVSASTDDKFNEYIVNFKLFNLFNIKKLKVNVIEPDRYFAGGDSLGFTL